MNLWVAVQVLARIGSNTALIGRNLLKPGCIDVAAKRRCIAEAPLQVVVGIEHYGAKTDNIVQALEYGPPGSESFVAIPASTNFIRTIVERRNDLTRHDDPGCQASVPSSMTKARIAASADIRHIPKVAAIAFRRVDEPIAMRHGVSNIHGVH